MKRIAQITLSLLLAFISQASVSEIYKWVDQSGQVRFSDKKPPQGQPAETVKLKINTVKVPKLYTHSSDDYAAVTDDIKSNKKVIMYGASWCGVCKLAKKYFNSQGIAYKEYDVETSAKGRRDFKRLRGRGVPIIFVGKKRMDGFDRSHFEQLYRG